MNFWRIFWRKPLRNSWRHLLRNLWRYSMKNSWRNPWKHLWRNTWRNLLENSGRNPWGSTKKTGGVLGEIPTEIIGTILYDIRNILRKSLWFSGAISRRTPMQCNGETCWTFFWNPLRYFWRKHCMSFFKISEGISKKNAKKPLEEFL